MSHTSNSPKRNYKAKEKSTASKPTASKAKAPTKPKAKKSSKPAKKQTAKERSEQNAVDVRRALAFVGIKGPLENKKAELRKKLAIEKNRQ